jgi:hypothetical protein
VDAGYDTETALASKDSLDKILPTRPDVVDVLVKAFVQPAGILLYEGFAVLTLIFIAVWGRAIVSMDRCTLDFEVRASCLPQVE